MAGCLYNNNSCCSILVGHGRGVAVDGGPQAKSGYVVLETNFRVMAYTGIVIVETLSISAY